MTNADYNRLTEQVLVLKEVVKDYPRKTIENIITQLEARVATKRDNWNLNTNNT